MANRVLRDWTELIDKKAPFKPGLYAFFDVHDNLLYIGSTWCLSNRIGNHKVKRFLIKKYGFIRVRYLELENYINIERELIIANNPPYNKRYDKPYKHHDYARK